VVAWAIVQEARRRAGLTQRALAERAGTSQAAIARIERGRQSPSIETLQRILHACGLELRMRIEPYDDHDERLIEDALALAPEGRVRAVEEMSRIVTAARRPPGA
jgi:transcriptional regulator with XRE-family HTH domain